jgi:dehydrogenase/reductase SDR family protein 7B
MSKSNNLAGKVVWITGASSGIGEALAVALARQGAALVLSARRETELLIVKEKCAGAYIVVVLPIDLEVKEELSQKVEWVISTMGTLYMLIHCAGLSQRSFAADTTLDVYRRIMEINYFATVQLSLAVLPHFLKQNEGQFVVMSSVAGKVGLPLRTAYSAAKHAIEGFFSSLRTELWRTDIKILVVRAGAVKTNIARNALTGNGIPFNKKDEIIQSGISPQKCAEVILKGVYENKKEMMVGSKKERLLFAVNRLFPGVAFNLVKKLGDKN